MSAFLETAKAATSSALPFLPWVSVAGLGLAILRWVRELGASRAAFESRVDRLDQRVLDDAAAAQLRGGHVAVELQGVKDALEKLRDDMTEARVGHAGLATAHDGLAGLLSEHRAACKERHPIEPARPAEGNQ